jgi:hypothetical protein
MEAELCIRNINKIEEIYGIHVVGFIGDNDSSAYKKVRENIDYFVQKYLDPNHSIKNIKTNLYNLVKNDKSYKYLLTDLNINKICSYTYNNLNSNLTTN